MFETFDFKKTIHRRLKFRTKNDLIQEYKKKTNRK